MTTSQALHKLLFSGAVPAKISRPQRRQKKSAKRHRLFEYLIFSFSPRIFSGPVWTPSATPLEKSASAAAANHVRYVFTGGAYTRESGIHAECAVNDCFARPCCWRWAGTIFIPHSSSSSSCCPLHDVLRATQSPPPFCQKRSFAFGSDNALPIPNKARVVGGGGDKNEFEPSTYTLDMFRLGGGEEEGGLAVKLFLLLALLKPSFLELPKKNWRGVSLPSFFEKLKRKFLCPLRSHKLACLFASLFPFFFYQQWFPITSVLPPPPSHFSSDSKVWSLISALCVKER